MLIRLSEEKVKHFHVAVAGCQVQTKQCGNAGEPLGKPLKPTHLGENYRKQDLKLSMMSDIASATVVDCLSKLKDKVRGETRKEIKSIAMGSLDTMQIGVTALMT